MTPDEYQALVGKPWTVQWVDSVDNPGVVLQDTLQFKEDSKGIKHIERVQVSTIQGSTIQSEVWATNCQVQSEGYVGVRSLDQRPFRIQLDAPNQLSCHFMDPTARQRQSRAVALGTLLGTLIGALVGFAGGFPVMGPLLGLAAALTSSLITSSTLNLREGSGASYTANDGTSSARPMISLHAVGA